MKKLFTILAATLFSVSMMADVDLTQGASYDFTTINQASFSGLDEGDDAYWSWNKNGYYGNTTKFTAGTALDFQLNAAGDLIAGLDGLKFINNGAGKVRIYVGTKNDVYGLYFDSANSKLVFPSLKADQVITITYKNVSSSEAGFTVTNADAVQDTENKIETLTVSEDGDVTVTYKSNKFYLETIEISAWVEPTKYVVTYVANNGEEPEGEAIDADASKVAACAFTAPTGKSFDSWNTKRNGTGTPYAVGDKVESDLTLYAQWVDLCTVTFNLQGHGDAIAEQIIEKGSKVTKPANPFTLDDYVFEGWYKEAACENAWDFANDVVNTDTELFAKWRSVCFEIVYSFKDGIGSAEVTADNATVTEEALSMSNTSGRITLTPKNNAVFKDNDNIILIGTVGNSSRPFGVVIGSQTIQTTDITPNDPEVPTAGGSAKVQGYLSLADDAATIAIGRAGGTTTTLTTCIIRRVVSCPDPTAIDNTAVGEKAVKTIENGQLVIIKNGVRYNAQGAVVK